MTGNEVRSILIENGFVLAEVANKLGITAQTLNSRLNAKNFKNEYLLELSNVLNMSFETKPVQNIDNLMSLIESQQRTIESLSRTIENLSKK
ncbi:helix-turn-helix transcriptional regulator [uncultured Bacteroides sp.]|jgi:transcriptional regulator with XRE-family HTH domain|uniref:helix-turn-helix domain-containing protein n=1 Tax=uncultured Bacteroides sp. TaxID=162156 RepID=UPI0025D92B31|nr:helix-turn-helix transcriptional regulator [uncultured Bacteroides sp.]